MHFNLAYFSFLFFHLKLKRQIRSYTPVVSSKNHTQFQTKKGKMYLFSDRKGAKTIPFGATHTYMTYLREYDQKSSGYKQETC